ncbi:hypothetical protein [Dyella telluris]|uniref:MFS transporter n=1 Tax=Dyella telluris TaxID=2763498 RepID=A0A7G8Q6U0_9GAMM|nr:hypothetical protein [Dyella telluris]QNK02498.1 hypothetical protein H8F01_04980 [Dyella telluris]
MSPSSYALSCLSSCSNSAARWRTARSLATFLRTPGGSVSASLTTFLWDRRADQHHARPAEHITMYNPYAMRAVHQLGGGDDQVGAGILNGMITQQGYPIAFNELFHALGWIFLGLVVFVWLARPPFGAKSDAGAGAH